LLKAVQSVLQTLNLTQWYLVLSGEDVESSDEDSGDEDSGEEDNKGSNEDALSLKPLKTPESDRESEEDSDTESTSGSDADQRGLSWDEIDDLIHDHEVEVIQVKIANRNKLKLFHIGNRAERNAAKRLIRNPPHNVMWWKVWNHHKQEQQAQKKGAPVKKLAKGQQTLDSHKGNNSSEKSENNGGRSSGEATSEHNFFK